MNKTILKLSALLIGALVIIAFWIGQGNNRNFSALPTETNPKILPSNASSSASWISNAMDIDQLVLEADLVVRARVVEPPITRVIRNELPVWDEDGNIVGSAISEVLFSDTVFEVLETYMGESSLKITIMQTGGFDPNISSGVEEIADDPLYKVGEEYILFLINISGDPVHAPDRELYRIVNPFGRYRVDIDNERVFSYGQPMNSVQLPADITELEAQIMQAAQEADNK